ncbi:SDR family oxidoreductase [Pimelobacter simplex]|uniref:SDR family oxidoreductase n=1 Tax=Nocardioides simplex TaxID=2045 RepID=UPI002150223A|nr:SDR family oxidoreductase [Pimelobacter simplex]UUW91451.1 SDR family oxidoreductase [Pimelobacter simplex]UUW95279.1 SDR family oxidoreductase [Pimelobacter simplex]
MSAPHSTHRAAVVTGAARGIGREIAIELAAAGHLPVLVDVSEQVALTAQELGGVAVRADLTTAEGRAAVRTAVDGLDVPLTLLVNNAGITRDRLIGKMTEEDFRAVLRVNLGATYELTAALADRIADGGAVVNLSSRAQLGNVGQFNYAVSKGGVIGCTRALALAHAPRLRVNAVAPGFIASEMTAAMPDEVRERVVASVPLGRAGQPADIAQTVRWLGSSEAGYVTGQVIYVCGGRSFG